MGGRLIFYAMGETTLDNLKKSFDVIPFFQKPRIVVCRYQAIIIVDYIIAKEPFGCRAQYHDATLRHLRGAAASHA
jgi:hypothetical protein